MKLKARIPFPTLVLTGFLIQCAVVLFVHFKEALIFHFTHFFVWLGLCVFFILLAKQGRSTWQATGEPAKQHPLVLCLKTAGLFCFVMLFSWQIYYLTLSQSQPLMFAPQVQPVRFDILSADLLGYTLRLVLQTWVLALALALVFNYVPRGNQFGCLRGSYKKLSHFAWYVGGLMSMAVTTTALFTLGLLVLDIGKFICKSLGADVMTVPQIDLVVFFFSLYLFDVFTGFRKKLKAWGEQPNTSVMAVLGLQLLFVLFVYCMLHAMLQFLPDDLVYSLMEPFYFDFLNYQRYPNYWRLFVTCLSIFMVPLLANYLYHACKGQPVLSSSLRLLLLPLIITGLILSLVPGALQIFSELSPTPELFTVTLDNKTSRYEVSWMSYLSVLLFLLLMTLLKYSQSLSQALVEMMPEHLGRRVRRMKVHYSRTYPFLVALLSLYLLSGAVLSLYFSSIFLLATLLGIGLCFVAGLKRQEISEWQD